MLFFKKKVKVSDENIQQNKYAIEELAGSIDSIVAGMENEEFIKRMRDIQEKIKYFNPTCDQRALDLDKKIADLIGDIKIEVVKNKEESAQEKIGGMITRIEMLVPDRNNFANSKRKV